MPIILKPLIFRNILLLWGYIALISYLISIVWVCVSIIKLKESPELMKKTAAMSAAALALVLHGMAIYQLTYTVDGVNLGFYSALSLICWVIAFLLFFSSMIKPTDNLLYIFLPASALALALDLIMPHTHVLPENLSVGLRLHILLSVTAYSLLAIAAVQAMLLAFHENQLRNKRPTKSIRLLPPMQVMENLLIQFIVIGFFLLSLSLSTGLVFVEDIFAQHLSHKVVFSIMAWLVFAIVLLGRWVWGWRGKKLIRLTLGGCALLLLAYFGSKLVLELILQKV